MGNMILPNGVPDTYPVPSTGTFYCIMKVNKSSNSCKTAQANILTHPHPHPHKHSFTQTCLFSHSHTCLHRKLIQYFKKTYKIIIKIN